MNFGSNWKADWLIGGLLTIFFVFAFQQENVLLDSLENSIYDTVARRALTTVQSTTDQRIVIINIDHKSLLQSNLTSTQALATTINILARNKANFIGITSSFSTLNSASEPLTHAIRQAGNVILPIHFALNTGAGTDTGTDSPDSQQTPASISAQLHNIALPHMFLPSPSSRMISSTHITTPNPAIMQAAAGMGHNNIISDNDGIVRHETLAIVYGNEYFPSLALMLAASTLNISLQDIRINPGSDIELGALNVPTDAKTSILPIFPQSFPRPFPQSFPQSLSEQGETAAFQTYTFEQLYQGEISSDQFNNKIVLIGTSDQQPNNTIATAHAAMNQTVFIALALQSILQRQIIQQPAWIQTLGLALILIIGLYLMLLLPRLTNRQAISISGIIFITLISSDFVLLHFEALWLQSMGAALLLLTGHIFFIGQHVFISRYQQSSPKLNIHATNKKLGISFQQQGMLEQAFDKFTVCPMNDDMLSTLYSLGQAFERKQQFKQATAVYQRIASHEIDYQDIQKRIQSTQKADRIASTEDPNTVLSNLLLSGKNTPTLGRYEIINELGKGAMGTVYLGKDPKINRKVAIKTMALSQEFEPQEIEEVKSKFFHEAEIAGMLNHPNIVTIFDAGDEQDLAYIAMEFLDGVDLSGYTKKDKLLPFATTLKIIAKIAEALQYAHDHGVIHRDIKPANIMILKNKTVKVTDFGIAHIIDSSKSKAGVVLGTPSYMSPEQLSGKKLDGRSDLFSLGVMLYELSCGTRPFKAESIAKLMYKIAKQPHADICEHNPEVPSCIRSLIDTLLTKKADQRIASARDVIKNISLCLNSLAQGESP